MGGLVPMAVVSRHFSLKGSQHGTEPEYKAQLCSSISLPTVAQLGLTQWDLTRRPVLSTHPHSIQAFVKDSLHRGG